MFPHKVEVDLEKDEADSEIDGGWRQGFENLGIKKDRNPTDTDGRRITIKEIYSHLRMGRYLNLEITVPVIGFMRRTPRNKYIKLVRITAEELKSKNLSSASLKKDNKFVNEFKGADGENHVFTMSSNDLKRILKLLRYDNSQVGIKYGKRIYVSKEAMVFYVSKAAYRILDTINLIADSNPDFLKNQKCRDFSSKYIVGHLFLAMKELFQEKYKIDFPFSLKKFSKEILNPTLRNIKTAKRKHNIESFNFYHASKGNASLEKIDVSLNRIYFCDATEKRFGTKFNYSIGDPFFEKLIKELYGLCLEDLDESPIDNSLAIVKTKTNQ